MKTATAVKPLKLGDFLGIWEKYFFKFMIGWGAEIFRAALYMILGISFLAVGLGLPPEVTAEASGRNGGMTLFMLIIGVTLAVRVITFTADFVKGYFNPPQNKPATAPQPEAK